MEILISLWHIDMFVFSEFMTDIYKGDDASIYTVKLT